MFTSAYSIIRCLAAALLVAGVNVQAFPAAESLDSTHTPHTTRATFWDDFNTFNTDIWGCEYTCPVIETGKARFRLRSGIPPDNDGSWSKARYKPTRFTSGRFTLSFPLTAPPEQPVWWGAALWDDGPVSDGSQFNEICFGYTTDQTFTKTQIWFESSRRGETEPIMYDSNRVAFYLDGKLFAKVIDKSFIPTDPMDLVLGPRLVTGGEPLTEGFTESIDWVEISY
ncbi:hypothetical protein DL770_010049 [Monosporascus sp. CRB-9-2]|nr:hypothetical protein DL770_010049 [Monosporascus sp. CRB-9-2]